MGDDSETERVAVSRDNYIHDADGEIIATAGELVDKLLHSTMMRDYLFSHGDTVHQYFTVDWDVAKSEIQQSFYLKSLAPEELRKVEFVEIRRPCEIAVEEFSIQQAKMDDVTVAWGEPGVLGKDALFVATEDSTGEQKLALKVGDREIEVEPPNT